MSRSLAVATWARKHIWGIVLLAALLLISELAIRQFKRPGQMTVIEAQAMDMSAMKPPVGSVPVATEIVARSPFAARVRYTGSVAAENQQDIYPRVEGWLTNLKVYSGDRVSAGQLLAVLDAPDIHSRLAEARYGETAASKEVPMAKANVVRMRAERDAARAEVDASTKDVESAHARLDAARQSIEQADKELKSARATAEYWRAEMKRQADLLRAGAISQKEFDADKAQAEIAEAEVENKAARVKEATSNVAAARAEIGSREASVKAATDRARAATASVSGAKSEVEQKAAGAQMASAAKNTAAAFDKYRYIRAPIGGVITARYLSSGVLVSPGTPIVGIAQIDRVRLQANVAETDLGRIRVGAQITATSFKARNRVYHAHVTSIAPLSDPTSRTAIVEAIIENRDHSLVPGDFVTMDITVGSSEDALTITSSAVTQKDGHDAVWIARYSDAKGDTIYTCTMHPQVHEDKPGNCPICGMKLVPKTMTEGKTAHLVAVTLGKTDGVRTEILSGLDEGEEVIYAGYRYLHEGDFVFPTKWGESGPVKLPPPPTGAKGMDMPGHDGTKMDMPGMNHDMQENKGAASEKPQEAKGSNKAEAQLYTCPMHPDFVTTDPKADCPKCGMNLVPKKD